MTKLQEEIEILKDMLKGENYYRVELEKKLTKTNLTISMIERQIEEKEKQSCGD